MGLILSPFKDPLKTSVSFLLSLSVAEQNSLRMAAKSSNRCSFWLPKKKRSCANTRIESSM